MGKLGKSKLGKLVFRSQNDVSNCKYNIYNNK